MSAKQFHLGDLLSITTHYLVSPDGISGVYRIVDFVTGQQHMTHQLGRAADVITPVLLEQHPWLAEIVVPADELQGEEAWMSWLAGQVERYGAMHDVEPMPFGAYVGREPIAELREMAPHAQIIELETDR